MVGVASKNLDSATTNANILSQTPRQYGHSVLNSGTSISKRHAEMKKQYTPYEKPRYPKPFIYMKREGYDVSSKYDAKAQYSLDSNAPATDSQKVVFNESSLYK